MAKSRNLPGGLQNSGTQAAVSTASRDEPGGQRHPAKRGVCSNSRLAGDLTQVAGSRRAAAEPPVIFQIAWGKGSSRQSRTHWPSIRAKVP